MRTLLPILASLALLGCVDDDVSDSGGASTSTSTTTSTSTSTSTTGTTTPDPVDQLTGTWLSEGDDIAPIFQTAMFAYVSITAVYASDGSYTVQATDGEGATYDFAGTSTFDTATTPHTIVQSQTIPYKGTAEGIWTVEGDVFTLEVVQTFPDYGFTPATPTSGFGSSAGFGLAPGDLVQVFRRQ